MELNILDKVKDSTQSFKDKIVEFKDDFLSDEQGEIIKEFKDGGVKKITGLLESINESNSIFVRTGYELDSINASLGLPPALTLSFQYKNQISDDERAQILEAAKENKMISIIVSCLFKADEFYEKIKMGNYKLTTVNITLGLTPAVSVSFKK